MREHYPSGGALACAPLLPGRSIDSIRLRAQSRNIRRDWSWNPATVPVAGPTGGGDARETVPPPKPAKRNGPMSFEEQMEAVANGARLVAVVPFRRADPAYSLGGTVGEIL